MDLAACMQLAADQPLIAVRGRVNQVIGMVIESRGPGIPVGSICEVDVFKGKGRIPAEVVGFREGTLLLMPLGEMRGVEPGSAIRLVRGQARVRVAQSLLGRVIDGLGNPMDGKGPLEEGVEYPLYAEPLNPMKRVRIKEAVDVGVRSINGLLTLGKGQRIAHPRQGTAHRHSGRIGSRQKHAAGHDCQAYRG